MFLDLLIDVILLAIIVGGSCVGYRKGLFKIVAGPIKNIICLLTALSLCDIVGESVIAPLISTPIKGYLFEFMQEKIGIADFAPIPTILRISGAVFGTSYDVYTADSATETIVDAFTEPLIALLSRTVAFILLFILLKYLIRLLMYLADSFLSFGIIGRLNRLLGAVLSITAALLWAWSFTSLVDYAFRLDGLADSRLVSNFDGGPLYGFFREISLLNLLLSF